MIELVNWDSYANLARWETLHADPKECNTLIGAIRYSWQRSAALPIDYWNARPEQTSATELHKVISKTKELCAYTKSLLDKLLDQNRVRNTGVILFSPDGFLLFLNGDKYFMSWAEENGIKVGNRWSEEVIGTNIFSIGVKRAEATMLKGEENYSRCLIGGNYYFAPISLDNMDSPGGITIVVRADKHNEFMVNIAVTLARAIELQFFWAGMFQIYSDISEGSGTLVIDQSQGRNEISLISDEIYNVFGIRRKKRFSEDLESIIDPLPANAAFWNIVRGKTKIYDKTVKITIDRKSVVVNVNASPFHESRFNMIGIVLNISSIKRINKLVSLYAGNTAHFTFNNVIGGSDEMRRVIQRSKNAACSNGSILLLGESGVGKDVIAQAIHNHSYRKDHIFVALNCAAFSKELIISELFGYEDGAFTGAKKGGSIGKFEMANNGTLFLDEIGDMPSDLQAVLLRVIEEQALRRVGGNVIIPVNVRIIAATNKNIYEQIRQGSFREDLFYRLGVIRIQIPPLRERRDDILQFAEHYINVICKRVGKQPYVLTKNARKALYEYDWPGNIRELQNLLEGIISTQEKPDIDARAIKDYFSSAVHITHSPVFVQEAYENDEKQKIEHALHMFRSNRVKAAAYLGLSRSTLYRRMREYGMLDNG